MKGVLNQPEATREGFLPEPSRTGERGCHTDGTYFRGTTAAFLTCRANGRHLIRSEAQKCRTTPDQGEHRSPSRGVAECRELYGIPTM